MGVCVPRALSPGGEGHCHRVVRSAQTHAQAQNKPSVKIQVSFHKKKNQKIYLDQILDWSKMLKVGRSLFWHPMMDSPVFMNCWFSPGRIYSFGIFQQAANISWLKHHERGGKTLFPYTSWTSRKDVLKIHGNYCQLKINFNLKN